MEIKTLENTSVSEILNAFNLAFSDYVTPLQLTENQLKNKIIAEDVDLNWSVGAFENNQLIGYILHGWRNNKLYNGGTGVIPEFRGKQITAKLYDFIFEKIKNTSISSIQLEVITENTKAISIYEKIGFEKIRTLNYYKGTLNFESFVSSKDELECIETELNNINTTTDYHPSWQNNSVSISNLSKIEDIKYFQLFHKKKNIGFLIFNATSKKIHQIKIDENEFDRRALISKELFYIISKKYSNTFVVTNIDESSVNTNEIFESVGLSCFLKQYEMILNL